MLQAEGLEDVVAVQQQQQQQAVQLPWLGPILQTALAPMQVGCGGAMLGGPLSSLSECCVSCCFLFCRPSCANPSKVWLQTESAPQVRLSKPLCSMRTALPRHPAARTSVCAFTGCHHWS
jgi:hypothetical protein